jgi:hypothetical protein
VAPTHPLPVVRYRMTTSCASPAALASAVASDGDQARIHLRQPREFKERSGPNDDVLRESRRLGLGGRQRR